MACEACARQGHQSVLKLRRSKNGKYFFGCERYPACKNSVFLPNSVESVKVRTETCEHHGSNVAPFTLDLKIKRGSLPPGFPTVIKRTCVVPDAAGAHRATEILKRRHRELAEEGMRGRPAKTNKAGAFILRACSQRTLLLLLRATYATSRATLPARALSSNEGRQRTYRTIDLLIMGMLEILYATRAGNRATSLTRVLIGEDHHLHTEVECMVDLINRIHRMRSSNNNMHPRVQAMVFQDASSP